MNAKEFNELVQETVVSTAGILQSKGVEYTRDANTDRLSFFKELANEVGVTPLQVAMIMLSKHNASLRTFIKNDAKGIQQILSEPIDWRIDDIINYCFLIKGLIRDKSA